MATSVHHSPHIKNIHSVSAVNLIIFLFIFSSSYCCAPPHIHTLPSVFCKYLRPFLGLLFDDVCSLAGCRCKHIFTNVRHLFLQPLRRQTRPVMSGSVTCRLRRVEFCFVSQLLWADEHCYFFRGFTQNTHSGSLHQLLSRLWCLQLL